MSKNETPPHMEISCCASSDSCHELPTINTFSRRSFLVSASILGASIGLEPSKLWASTSKSESYSKLILDTPNLKGYWRFDGDTINQVRNTPSKVMGDIAYAEGVMSGKALSLNPNNKTYIQQADALRGKSATVELFFRLEKNPTDGKDTVIIAQTKGKAARYVLGVKHDLSAITYSNTKLEVVTTAYLPTDKPIALGRWYHLAMTSYDLDLRIYIDGFECALFGGAYEYTRRGVEGAPMSFGHSSLEEWGDSTILIDEVACYGVALNKNEIQKHLKESAWSKNFEETAATVKAVANKRNKIREKKFQKLINDPVLIHKGKTKQYKDTQLSAIAFTVGGIGAGAIQFNGNAEPEIWQIAKNFTHEHVPDTFLGIRTESENNVTELRALQSKSVGKFKGMSSLTFEGEYPFAHFHFKEKALPVQVSLEVFNPLIPMDLKNSAIPCAIYTIKVKNTSNAPVNVTVLASQKNALGYTKSIKAYGGNKNTIRKIDDATVLHMTQDASLNVADMSLMTTEKECNATAEWSDLNTIYDEFGEKGILDGSEKSRLSALGKTVNGALAVPFHLDKGEEKEVTFTLAWYFKNIKHGSKGAWKREGQMYNNWWTNSFEVSRYLKNNLASLTAKTRLFHDTLYASNLPIWLLDRMTSQFAVLRSQSCWWSADGYFGVWEGVNETSGCCAGNCTHVWQYAQGHARLFPELGKIMREQDYSFELKNGMVPNRHGSKESFADGHFGTILNTYREYLCSTDMDWLKSKWLNVKHAMDYAIHHWNPAQDGYMTSIQHNTLDGSFMGCSSWIGTLYLTTLEASARMADLMGDTDSAKHYREIRESGQKLQNERLWNGEYYIQKQGEKRMQDYLDGCHIDQLLGEWWASQLNIDENYPQERTKKALDSLLKNNFFTDFHGQSLKPRQYVEKEDAGMKMITWPKENQPVPGMKYGDETMTGFEYSAGVTMIQSGMIKEGLTVLKAVYDRYDGRLRTEGVTPTKNGPWGYSGNPYGDDECGKYYGRSLSIWSALLALQGFLYDGPQKIIGFKPRFNIQDHTSFFTVAEGYGLFKQSKQSKQMSVEISLTSGDLYLKEIVLEVDKQPTAVGLSLAGKKVSNTYKYQPNEELRIVLAEEQLLIAGKSIDIQVLM